MNISKAADKAIDILREAYFKADPPLNFREALENGYCAKPDWFHRHTIDEKLMEKIIKKHTEGVNKFWTNKIRSEVMNYGPRYKDDRQLCKR